MIKTKKKSISSMTERVVEVFVEVSMVIMVLLVFSNAVLRYAFNSSITQSEELSRYFFVWVSFLGAIIAFKDKKHVGVDVLVSKLKGKSKIFVDIFGNLLILFTTVIMFLGGISFIEVLGDTKGPATGLPLAVIAVTIVVCAISMALIVFIDMFKSFKELFANREV
jgi:TRAP-type C4-dicarboxylate transport system permease small subunit